MVWVEELLELQWEELAKGSDLLSPPYAAAAVEIVAAEVEAVAAD